MAANVWKNGLKNVVSDNNKIMYDTLLDFFLQRNDEREYGREYHISITRYLTYAGLCIATCIIFQKNTFVASLIGLSVALYISVSEYFLSSSEKSSNLLPALDIGKLFSS